MYSIWDAVNLLETEWRSGIPDTPDALMVGVADPALQRCSEFFYRLHIWQFSS